MSWLTTPETASVGQTWSPTDQANASSESESSNSWYDPECDYIWPNDAEKVVICFVYILIGLVGFIGNFLVIFTIFFKRGSQSVTSMLLCSLAVSDIIVVSIYLPLKLTDFMTVSWVMGPIPCKLTGYLTLISPSCSACMLMVIGLERFIVVLYPLRARWLVTKLRAKIIVACTWIISLALGVPGLIFQEYSQSIITNEFICTKNFETDNHRKGYQLYGLTIIFIIPLVVMGFTYTTVCVRLYASAKTSRTLQSMKAPASSGQVAPNYTSPTPRPSNFNSSCGGTATSANPNVVPSSVDDDPFSAGSEGRCETSVGRLAPSVPAKSRRPRRPHRPVSLKDRQQVILMLILVVVLYAITWGPLLFFATLFNFDLVGMLCMNVVYQISAALHVMAFINSAINPIVYSFMSRNFRETVVETFSVCCRCLCMGRGKTRGQESMYYNSRHSSTTMVAQPSSMRRGRAASDCNCSPSRGPSQIIEMTQYTRLPSSDPMA